MRKADLGLILLILLVGILPLLPFPWNEPIEDSLIDLQFKLRGDRQLSDEFVLVYLGAEDAQALGGWPITRDYYGYMTHVLSRLGAKVIGFDILFDITNHSYPEYDSTLAGFFESAGNVCLSMKFTELARGQIKTGKIAQPPDRMMTGHDAVFPFQLFRDQTAGLGFSNFNSAPIVRKVPLVAADRDSFMLSFGGELAHLYLQGVRPVELAPNRVIMSDSAGNQHVFPIDRQGQLRLNHFGNLDDVSAIGFVDLLKIFERAPDSLDFNGKVVIVAATLEPTLKATPLAHALPGSLIHATMAENLIHHNYLREASKLWHFVIITLMVIFAWRVWEINNSQLSLVVSVGILLAYWIAAILLFSKANLVLPLFYPLFAFLISLSYAGVRQSRRRRFADESTRKLLQEQISSKEIQLEEAKLKLAEWQMLLQQQAASSVQTRQLAEERQNAILALEKELRDLRTYAAPEEASTPKAFPEIVHAANGKMAQILAMIDKVGSQDIPVLILGETGTGKEMIARAIHQSGKRRNAPFVAINCGALPETLLESELFGHEKGSFTGAVSRRRGRFELADKGTIFLDEITETATAFQTRLLRVLQEGTFERVGGDATIRVEVRVIAACNKDLPAAVKADLFRADLFYRLNGFPITLPPLRERCEDIPLLAVHFLRNYGYPSVTAFSDRAMEILKAHHWPGNVRELENIVRRAVILAQSEKRDIIQVVDLPKEITEKESPQQAPAVYQPLEAQILEMLRALKFSRSAITQTAKALGNRDRGTITEYFRGLCFEYLMNAHFDVEKAAQAIAATNDDETIGRVRAKMDEYLKNLRTSDASEALFKGLPKKYHSYLQQIIQHFR